MTEQPLTVDLLIHASWIIPVVPEGVVLENHAIVVHQGRILDLLPQAKADQRYQPRHCHRLEGHVLIPGLVNAHTHIAMNLLRGLADDLPLMTWLQEHIWPAEQRWMSEHFVADGSRLAITEMLRGGTTCFNDMYFHPDTTAEVATEMGIRANLGMILVDFPSCWASTAEEYIHKGLMLRDQYAGHPLVNFSFAPHAPYSVGDESLDKMITLANELDPTPQIHMHVHETQDEVQQSLKAFGCRPLERLSRLGLLGPNLMAVHMTQLTEAEIALVAETGCHIIHCPESNLKLANGFCPINDILKAGINVALGTDGAASNNDLDLLGEMRTASLVAKGISHNPAVLPAHQALSLATIHGARALGLDQEIGSLEIGKAADLVALDLRQIETQPLYHPISQLVYASNRSQVAEVWVAGRHLVSQGKLIGIDTQDLMARAAQWQGKIAAIDPGTLKDSP